MPTHVYANGLEIACKATEGTASTAFPDPCWSPPGPPAGPLVIPYGNVAHARDLTNGSCTVFIGGQTVALEDQSYFATSTGNEAATRAFGQGVATGVIQGKAYYRSWSMDVMIEGKGVARHSDLVSHNHGSFPSNTPMFPYVSRKWGGGHDCKQEEKRIERACKPEREHSDARKEVRAKGKIGSLLKKTRRKNATYDKNKKWHWSDDHCDGLHIKIGQSLEDAEAYANELKEVFTSMPQELAALLQIEDVLKEMAFDAAKWAALKFGGKVLAKQAIGTAVPLVGNIAMGLWSAVDAVLAIGDVKEIQAVAREALEQIDVLRKEFSELDNLAKRFKGFKNLSDKEKLALAADGQGVLATLNACTRARKCMLVPYQNKGGKGGQAEPASPRNPTDPRGCCPGQTGHHLIPDVMVKTGTCSGYSKGSAPTVCVEGATQNHGTHKLVHDNMDNAVGKRVRNGKAPNGRLRLTDVIAAAAESHAEAFPASACSEKCLRAQLENYYQKACPGSTFEAKDKRGKQHRPGDQEHVNY